MLEAERIIPKSRIAPAAKVSREYAERVMRELKREGRINPERTATGRHLLSFAECRVIWERLGLQ